MIKKIIDFPFPQNFSQMPKNVIDFNKNISLKSLPFKTKISNPLLMSTRCVSKVYFLLHNVSMRDCMEEDLSLSCNVNTLMYATPIHRAYLAGCKILTLKLE